MKPMIIYDSNFDILRLYFGENEPASYEEVADGIYIRYSEEADKITGIEIHGIKVVVTKEESV